MLQIIAAGSPHIAGQEVPQSFQTWPPQSSPWTQLAGARRAQHAGSGAKQAAPSGQQPVHSAGASKTWHSEAQQDPWRMLHWPAGHGTASGHIMRHCSIGESGHHSGAGVGAGAGAVVLQSPLPPKSERTPSKSLTAGDETTHTLSAAAR